MPSRDRMAEDLAKRTEDNYTRRDRERLFDGVFKKGQSLPIWNADKGEHLVDLIPYQVGEHDPRLEKGSTTYVLDFYAHRNVGPRDLWFVCMEATYKLPCPICKERNRIQRTDTEDMTKREEDAHGELLKELRPSRRVIYNIVCLDTNEQEDKGVQVWEVAHFLMESKILAQAKIPKRDGGGILIFSDADTGRSVYFDRTGVGKTNTEYVGHQFRNREPLPDDWLEDAYTLDDLIHLPTYEEVEEAFFDASQPAEGGSEEEDPKPRRGRVSSEDDREEEESRPRRRREAASEDDGDPPSRRRSGQAADEGLEDEPPRRRNAKITVEDDDPPRRRSSRTTEDDDDDPPPRRRAQVSGKGKLQKVEEEDEDQECPAPDGKFGRDANRFDECEECDLYPDCVRATVKARKDRLRKADDDIPF